MRLVATLLVRDELDVLAANLEHHFAAGVDAVVVTDNGSVDGTRELLAEYTDRAPVTVIDEPAHTYRQSEWVTRMARLAVESLGADWLVHLDADEFGWTFRPGGDRVDLDEPQDVDLAGFFASLPAGQDVCRIRRDNMVGDLATPGSWPHRLVWRDTLALSERGTRIGDKAAHRADPAIVVEQGNHAVSGERAFAMTASPELVMLHVPDRGWEHYRRKIDQGGRSYEASGLPEEAGWHWRADYRRLQEGSLRETWEARQHSQATLRTWAGCGRIVPDDRLLRRLDMLRVTAIHPQALDAVLGAGDF